ncbi:MAG: hypothetical protein ACI9R3_003729 [Verrucomicrobiales bacterium]
MLRFLEGEGSIANALDVLGGQLAVLLSHVLAQGTKPLRGVDELNLAFAVIGFSVCQHPDVGGDAGVVEHVQRQRDDGLQPVALNDPAADVAFALSGIACEQGRSVVHLGDAAAERGIVLHLAQHIGKKHHLSVAGASDQGVFGIARVGDDEARVSHSFFTAHSFEIAFPTLAVGRIGEHEVELTRAEGVVRERRVLRATDNVIGSIAITFEQEVGFADRIGFGVDLLPNTDAWPPACHGSRQFVEESPPRR